MDGQEPPVELLNVNNFGPIDCYNFIANTFVDGETTDRGNPKTPRDLFSYGVFLAKEQWALTLGIDKERLTPNADDTCFLCKMPFKLGGKSKAWNSPQVEHLLPSALAFLLFGLPANLIPGRTAEFTKKIASIPGLSDKITTYLKTKRDIQIHNYKWAHTFCNGQKRDMVFLNILKATESCFNPRLMERCEILTNPDRPSKKYGGTGAGIGIGIGNGDTVKTIDRYIDMLLPKPGEAASESKKLFGQTFNGKDPSSIGMNIIDSYQPIIAWLNDYSSKTGESLIPLIAINLRFTITIITSESGGIPTEFLDKSIEKLDTLIKGIFIGGKKSIRGGGEEEAIPEGFKITGQEFDIMLNYFDFMYKYNSQHNPVLHAAILSEMPSKSGWTYPTNLQTAGPVGLLSPQASTGGPLSNSGSMTDGGRRRTKKRKHSRKTRRHKWRK